MVIRMWPWRQRIVCRRAAGRVTDYLEGALSCSQRARFEAHLRQCPHCAQYLQQFRAAIQAAGPVQPDDLQPGAKAELMHLYRRSQGRATLSRRPAGGHSSRRRTGEEPGVISIHLANVASARLRDLAVELAAHRDLRVSVITYEDGTEELEVLHTGPPHRDENTIDRTKFAGQARAAPDWTLYLAGESGIRNAANLIRAALPNASAPSPQAGPRCALTMSWSQRMRSGLLPARSARQGFLQAFANGNHPGGLGQAQHRGHDPGGAGQRQGSLPGRPAAGRRLR